MTIKTEEVERLMKQCQIGVGGKGALDKAHGIMADCYGTLGALVQERDKLRAVISSTAHIGRHCLSEDDCIAGGIDFASYERGVNDAANAIDRNAARAEQQGRPVKPHRSGGGMPAEPLHLPLPSYLPKE